MYFGDKESMVEKLAQKKNSKKLVALLKDRQPEIRKQVIVALGKIGDEMSVNTLIGMLSDPDPATRKVVIASMGGMANQTIKSHLQHLITTEKDASVKQAISDALARIPKVN
jgi:HEAT repeat protein